MIECEKIKEMKRKKTKFTWGGGLEIKRKIKIKEKEC